MSQKASKILLFLLPVCAAMMLQACFDGGGRHHYGRGYGYSPPPAYAAPPPAYAYRQPPPPPAYRPPPPAYGGDYDGHHVWHDRDWWVKNDRPWVEHHHPTWLGAPHHDHEHHDHDYEEH